MGTKAKGDIAEMAVILKALQLGWEVLRPIGDRLPYDCVVVVDGEFFRIQIKAAWPQGDAWKVDHRQCKTNRQVNRIETYNSTDFDFLVAHIIEVNESYVIPIEVMLTYGGGITLKGERSPKAARYLEAWEQLTTRSGAVR